MNLKLEKSDQEHIPAYVQLNFKWVAVANTILTNNEIIDFVS